MTKSQATRLGVACALLAFCATVRADEGMWLFNSPPTALLKSKYNFDVTPGWLEHLQKASVRFDNGGSGSFVSPHGLVMTNQHVGTDCVQNISSQAHDYVQTGFYARTQAEELKCPNLELDVLMNIQDVTGRVNAAVPAGASLEAAEKARRAVINTIEKESLDKTGLRSNVVTLYNGGEYQLYRYKQYTDVRLVFVPEKEAAFFGGDPDNFEYPRYDLDICFFRVYENNQPAKTPDYLKWKEQGAQDGELVFVSGNPAATSRLDTIRHLEFLRDRSNPWALSILFRREVLLRVYSERSVENRRRAEDQLLEVQNSRKAYVGMQAGLQDPALIARKQAEENKLKEAVEQDGKLRASYGNAWEEVAATLQTLGGIYVDLSLLETGQAFHSKLFDIARTLVRLAEESQKPNAARLREYSEANLASLKQDLFSDAPIYDDLEALELGDSLGMYAEIKGMQNALVAKVLAGKSPDARAEELVRGTKLKDVAERKRLAHGGMKAIEASTDPMILLARLVDPESRRLRSIYDNQVDEPRREAYAKIAQARFAVYGKNVYPDATFTLRLSFGQVKGYVEDGKQVSWTTTFGGAFQHAAQHDNEAPFQLPARWTKEKSKLDLSTPLDFVNTADIIGGNSGSPVVNRDGDLVGIIFDGNIQSLVLDYIYTDQQARAVAVQSAAIAEALEKIYDAERLVSELGLH
ncbi:MAG TPA: S46 family peptidase [Bryobacteraceae bacterium]|nr:S46 family peptidase [Bryobacteraceae bacterium]